MNVLQHLATVLADLLCADERRVVLGEDVADGTMLGLTRVAAEDPALAPRLLATPLCPTVLPAHAAGLAAEGYRPIVVTPEASALVDSLAALREAAKLGWRHETPAPVVYLAPFGPGFGLGGGATEGPASVLSRVPGLRVVVLSEANDAGAVLRAAVEGWAGDEPTVVLIPRRLALAPVTDAPEALARPFATPRRVREGQAATVFTWGACLPLVQAAVEQSGQDARIVDVECLAPLDRAALAEEAKATGKIVIAHEGPRHCGVGSELAALFADDAILTLDAPVLRVTGDDGPLTASAEGQALPNLEALATAITHVATY
jgi:pyruvate/2-oxoglutarate/acetoin dehydrogenase E1 component